MSREYFDSRHVHHQASPCMTNEAPSSPSDVRSENSTVSSIEVVWDAPTESGSSTVVGYVARIYRHGARVAFAEVSSQSTSAVFTGLLPLTSYTVKVAAVNDEGIGAWSDASDVITTLAVPPKCTTNRMWPPDANKNTSHFRQHTRMTSCTSALTWSPVTQSSSGWMNASVWSTSSTRYVPSLHAPNYTDHAVLGSGSYEVEVPCGEVYASSLTLDGGRVIVESESTVVLELVRECHKFTTGHQSRTQTLQYIHDLHVATGVIMCEQRGTWSSSKCVIVECIAA